MSPSAYMHFKGRCCIRLDTGQQDGAKDELPSLMTSSGLRFCVVCPCLCFWCTSLLTCHLCSSLVRMLGHSRTQLMAVIERIRTNAITLAFVVIEKEYLLSQISMTMIANYVQTMQIRGQCFTFMSFRCTERAKKYPYDLLLITRHMFTKVYFATTITVRKLRKIQCCILKIFERFVRIYEKMLYFLILNRNLIFST